jgi:hypothetical protein
MASLSLIKQLGLTGVQYNALSSLAETDLSASAIIARLQGTEAAIRRQTGFQAINALRGVISTRPYINSVTLNARPNPNRIPFALTTQKRAYSYRLELSVINEDTGETEIVTRNLSSSTLLTKQEAIDSIMDAFAETNSTSGVEFDSARVIQITQTPLE